MVYESSDTQGGTTTYGPEVAGATVSTSLDGQTATTDEGGRFFLLTLTQRPPSGCFQYTVAVSAPGLPSFSATGNWGEAPVVAIVLDPPSPVVPRC